jgi:uncharacterized protein with GYD domain
MPTYVSLLNFTDQGIRTIRDTTQRGERAAQTAQKHGISFKGLYWTVGPYDVVNIFEAPDEESATAYMLEVGSWGPFAPPRFGHTSAKRCRGLSRGWGLHRVRNRM